MSFDIDCLDDKQAKIFFDDDDDNFYRLKIETVFDSEIRENKRGREYAHRICYPKIIEIIAVDILSKEIVKLSVEQAKQRIDTLENSQFWFDEYQEVCELIAQNCMDDCA